MLTLLFVLDVYRVDADFLASIWMKHLISTEYISLCFIVVIAEWSFRVPFIWMASAACELLVAAGLRNGTVGTESANIPCFIRLRAPSMLLRVGVHDWISLPRAPPAFNVTAAPQDQ